MTEPKEVVEGLLEELDRYLGPAMTHIPSVAKAKEWLDLYGKSSEKRGKNREFY